MLNLKVLYSTILFIFSTQSFASIHCPKKEFQLVHSNSRYCKYRGELERKDPISGVNRKIPFTYYFSLKSTAPLPLVIVYPSITGEIPLVETLLSKKLVNAGFHSLVAELVEDISDLERRPKEIDDFFIRSMWGVKEITDLALEWNEVLNKDISAMGVSLGGIRAAFSYGNDLRIKRLITYVAGGNLPSIFAQSEVDLIVNYRNHWMEKLGMDTADEFQQYLEQTLTLDPLKSPYSRDCEKCLMVLAKKDLKVPYNNQLQLLEAYPDSTSRFTSYAHRVTGASFLTHFNEVVEALRK